LDLDIAPGAITAILGGNGAGKSTLIKLLCRLYDPQGGSITLGGADLRDLGLDDLRSRLAVLTQEPVRYSTSAAECIGLGDLTEAGPSQDATAIAAAAQAAGAAGFIVGLPEGYATPLGLWFEGGVELSGGQWQRLALARALIRRAPVLILDEPTSALDPWAEARWLDGLRGLTRGRTVLLITHRLTAAALADRIHVMDAGRIVESGTHLELVAAEWRQGAFPTLKTQVGQAKAKLTETMAKAEKDKKTAIDKEVKKALEEAAKAKAQQSAAAPAAAPEKKSS
jgi:ATP-binding cassette subfamily B protein